MEITKKRVRRHKWTEEIVTLHLSNIRKVSEEPKVYFMHQALTRFKLYPDIWRYWKKIFEGNETIIEEMLLIEGIFEVKLFEAGLYEKISADEVMFALRNRGWGEVVV